MYLIFDTETNGLPKNYNAKMQELDNWPRVIQLAWALFDKDRNLIREYRELIIPDGWEIPAQKFWIDNNYSTAASAEHGVPINKALNEFAAAYGESKYLIAHNMKFDHPILGAELLRAIHADPLCADSMIMDKSVPKLCTMLASVDLCRLPSKFGFKWPKLEELHHFLFNEGFDGAHDAGADVKACARCLFELIDRGIIDLTKYYKQPENEQGPT